MHPQYSEPFIPPSLRPTHRSYISLLFLGLWLLSLVLIALPPLFKTLAGDDFPLPDLIIAFQCFDLLLPLFFLALWFSLQAEIAQTYIPAFPIDQWSSRTLIGTAFGTIIGLATGISGYVLALFLTNNHLSTTWLDWPIILPSLAGLLVGFGFLGWHQTTVLHHAVPHAYLWTLLMSVAWLPVILTWFLYDAFLSVLTINIYPDLHNLARLIALQVALLVPILSSFALLLKLSSPRLSPRPKLPLSTLTILLTPVLLLALLILGLLSAQSNLIERAWVVPGSPYLRIDPSGQVITSPSPGEPSTLSTNLSDISIDASLRAQISDTTILLSSTTDPTPILTISPFLSSEFGGYGDILNIVRFNPSGTLLAAGTGETFPQYDSAMNYSDDHAVHIWSIPGGLPLYTLTEPHYTVNALAWSPDGRYIAAAGGITSYDSRFNDTVIRIWSLSPIAPPTLHITLTGHTTPIQSLAWTPDSTKLISRDATGLTAIWRIK